MGTVAQQYVAIQIAAPICFIRPMNVAVIELSILLIQAERPEILEQIEDRARTVRATVEYNSASCLNYHH